jgi:hypothetical protein
MTDCPSWKKPQPTVAYMGSARSGLGFYHIDLPKCETMSWLNISKCGVVEIRKGAISMQELEKELSEIFCREWSWQIREITPAKFLVRFPPHRKVSDIKSLPSFNLRKEGVQVGVVEWMGVQIILVSLRRFGLDWRGSHQNGVLGKCLLRWFQD